MSFPINLPKHGLSKDEAAEYCSVSVKTLDGHGPAPTKSELHACLVVGDGTPFWERDCELRESNS